MAWTLMSWRLARLIGRLCRPRVESETCPESPHLVWRMYRGDIICIDQWQHTAGYLVLNSRNSFWSLKLLKPEDQAGGVSWITTRRYFASTLQSQRLKTKMSTCRTRCDKIPGTITNSFFLVLTLSNLTSSSWSSPSTNVPAEFTNAHTSRATSSALCMPPSFLPLL